MWVKICGITRPEDAAAAAALGADAIGLVLTQSPRRADPEQVKDWIHDIHWVEKVGVFTQEHPSEILAVGELLGLNTVQLHGQLTPEHAPLFDRFAVIYAVGDGVRPDGWRSPDGPRPRILVDASRGTGQAGVWAPRPYPYILAGGLHPGNVREAVRQARPAGVDVSSGVESAPGIKDVRLMERFIKEARA